VVAKGGAAMEKKQDLTNFLLALIAVMLFYFFYKTGLFAPFLPPR
jgi:hypothetical protein